MTKSRVSLPKNNSTQTAKSNGFGSARLRPAAGKQRVANGRDRIWPWIVGAAVTVVLVLAATLYLARPQAIQAAPGERFPIQGREHIEPGTPHAPYNSDPPTSGPHYPTPLPAGFYDQPQADEYLVHNLEHGHVVISYDCSKLTDCEGVKQQLRALVKRYNTWKIVAVPRKNKDAAIALTAWGWLEKLDGYDEARMTAFINAWRDKGPEHTAD